MATSSSEDEISSSSSDGVVISETPAIPEAADRLDRPFRFYDNRQKYLMFVNTCNEKWVLADRVSMQLGHLSPSPPALRVFDGGTGDGTILAKVMRDLHRGYPTVPFFVLAKEISLEDVRLCLEKMPDRLAEHPATVLVFTNLYYSEAPGLTPGGWDVNDVNWHETPLSGDSACDYDEQIKSLDNLVADAWQVKASEKTGNPLYVKPSVFILYREDHRFLLDGVVPKRGQPQTDYDLIIASQPFRARMPAEFKAKKVLAPMARSLSPGGRMLVAYSHGNDPGMEIVRSVWPDENPFQTNRHILLKALKAELAASHPSLIFDAMSDSRSLFRYQMHTLPDDLGSNIGTSALMAAWNAATYVAQIEEQRVSEAMSNNRYLEETQKVLEARGGLWFFDESFVVSRRQF